VGTFSALGVSHVIIIIIIPRAKNKKLEWLEVKVVAGKETVTKKHRVKPLDGDCDALK